MEEIETTRRGFVQAMGTVAVFGDDDEDSLLDKIFGDEPQSGDYTFKFGTREEFENTEAEEKTAFRIIPDGLVYRAVEDEDSLIGGQYNWKEVPTTGPNPEYESVTTEELLGEWDHLISSASGIENIDATLSEGDIARVGQPDTSYRTSTWIDIDTSNVSLQFESRYAKNGEPIVKVADGANVGGIRIGWNSHTETVEVRNFGFDGNKDNQDQTITRLHGLIVEDAADVDIINGHYQYTSPWHDHNTGGSGISLHTPSRNVRIENIRVDNIGDRGVQMAGEGHEVEGVFSTNGFDRAVATNLQEPDDTAYAASYCTISNVVGRDHVQGSIVGVDGGSSTWCQHVNVSNVAAFGQHRNVLHVKGQTRHVNARNLTAQPSSQDQQRGGVQIDQGPSHVRISGVQIDGSHYGVYVYGDVDDARVRDATIRNTVDKGVYIEGGTSPNPTDVTVEATVINAGGVGAQIGGSMTHITLEGCIIEKSTDAGVVAGSSGDTLRNCVVRNNQQGDNSGVEIYMNGTDQDLIDVEIVPNASDLNVGSATRPRWDGVIWGGRLGGVDLTTVTGQEEGDKAMSNGTNTTAYLQATWTGSAWQPSDGGATI